MLFHKKNTGRCLAALALCGFFALQTPAVPAMAAQETLKIENQNFYRSDGTQITGAVAKGVTISKYQNQAGPIDWAAMKADGVNFAMIRVAYMDSEEPYLKEDPYFKENIAGALQNGIRVGVFYYTRALDENTVRQEAQFVLDKIKDYPISYPVAYDVESKYLLDTGKTPQELANHVNIFCKAIADAGYRPMLYGNNEWLTKHIDISQVPYDIWYARYGTNGEFTNRKIWQFTETGTVAGITGNVCLEVSYYDYPELANAAASKTYTVGSSNSGGPGVNMQASGQTQATPAAGQSSDTQTGPGTQAGGAVQTSTSPTPATGQDESQLTKSPSES